MNTLEKKIGEMKNWKRNEIIESTCLCVIDYIMTCIFKCHENELNLLGKWLITNNNYLRYYFIYKILIRNDFESQRFG